MWEYVFVCACGCSLHLMHIAGRQVLRTFGQLLESYLLVWALYGSPEYFVLVL